MWYPRNGKNNDLAWIWSSLQKLTQQVVFFHFAKNRAVVFKVNSLAIIFPEAQVSRHKWIDVFWSSCPTEAVSFVCFAASTPISVRSNIPDIAIHNVGYEHLHLPQGTLADSDILAQPTVKMIRAFGKSFTFFLNLAKLHWNRSEIVSFFVSVSSIKEVKSKEMRRMVHVSEAEGSFCKSQSAQRSRHESSREITRDWVLIYKAAKRNSSEEWSQWNTCTPRETWDKKYSARYVQPARQSGRLLKSGVFCERCPKSNALSMAAILARIETRREKQRDFFVSIWE